MQPPLRAARFSTGGNMRRGCHQHRGLRIPRKLFLCCHAAALFASLFFAGCATKATGAGIVPLALRLYVADDANKDAKGRPAPIMVRLYELKSAAAFEEADFFSLQAADKSMLGDDLLARDEFILRPGERRSVDRPSTSGFRQLGILAAYRELPKTIWRAVYVVPTTSTSASTWYGAPIPLPPVHLQISVESGGIKLREEK